MKFILSLILSVLITCAALFGQEQEQVFYQLIEKGKLIKITEQSNKLEFKELDFKTNESVFLLSYDSRNSTLRMLTQESKILITTDLDGKIIKQEQIEGLPQTTFVISTMDKNSNLYLGSYNPDFFYKINLKRKNKTVKKVQFSQRIMGIFDVVYNNSNGFFYSIDGNGHLIKINPKNGESERIEHVNFEKGLYGSIWQDNENAIYGYNNQSGKIYKYDKTEEQVLELGETYYKGHYNDGTAVINSKAEQLDNTEAEMVLKKEENKRQEETESLVVSPNPTMDMINMEFTIPIKEVLEIKLLDLTGQEVRMLHHGYVKSGLNRLSFNASALAAGSYFVTVNSSEKNILNEKIIVTK